MADISVLSLPSTPIITLMENVPVLGTVTLHDSVLATLAVSLLILIIGMYLKSTLKLIPGKFQVFMEMLIGFFMTQLTAAWGSEERAKKALPLIFTIFLFLLIANQFSVIPLVAAVLHDGELAFRTPTSSLGLTVTLAVMMIIGSHLYAFAHHPFKHLGNYFPVHRFLKVRNISTLFDACLGMFLGLLDIIGELAKIMSMSCRLFGNIFAGEIMIAIITGLTTYFMPMPFMLISFFSGVVQAFVFSLLATNFMAGIVLSSEPQKAHA
jgi:F-type H+-transporting ATPase subunit a